MFSFKLLFFLILTLGHRISSLILHDTTVKSRKFSNTFYQLISIFQNLHRNEIQLSSFPIIAEI